MSRWLISTGPLGVREAGGQPTRPVADFVGALAAALVAQGEQVLALFTERAPNAHELAWLKERGVDWRFWGQGRPVTLRHAAVLHEVLRAWNPRAAMFEFGGVSMGISLAWLHRVPIRIARYLTAIAAAHHDGQVVDPFRMRRRRYVYRCATHVAVNADALRGEVMEVFGVPARKVIVQLQGVARPPRALPDPTSRVRELVCVGRLAPTKGQHVLIDALGVLKKRGLTTRAHFIGDGDRADLEARAARLGVADACVFHGAKPRAGVYEALLTYAIAVQPSLADALPQSAQEAVACGAVLVASHVGGIPSLVDDERSGLLVPPGRPDALAGALASLLTDGTRLQQLARTAAVNAHRVAMDECVPVEAVRLKQLAADHEGPGRR